MKKENKKLAQQQRKMEREREARNQMVKKYSSFGAVLLIVILVVVGCVLTNKPAKEETATTNEGQQVEQVQQTQQAQPVLVTEEGIEIVNGDTVNIDYVGYVDDEAFQGGDTRGQGTDLTIGSGAYIPGFEDQIIGHKVGETFDLIVTFPENYGAADLAGKEAKFVTTINGVYKTAE